MAVVLNLPVLSCGLTGGTLVFTAGSTGGTNELGLVDWNLVGPAGGYRTHESLGSPSRTGFTRSFTVDGLPNGNYTLSATNEAGDTAVRTFTITCQVCDLTLGIPTYPTTGHYSIPFTTQAGDGLVRFRVDGGLVGLFVPSPYGGTGTVGQTYALVAEDRNGCTQALTITIQLPAPTLDLLTPNQGPKNTKVLLTGTRLSGTTQVTVGGIPVAYQVNSNTELQVTMPGTLPVGIGQVRVIVGSEQTGTLPYTVTGVVLPVVHQVAVPGWTLSWQLDFNSWTGEHTTIPTTYLTRSKDTYRTGPGAITKQSTTLYGLPLTLEVVDREAEQVTFDTLILQQEVTDQTLPQPFQRYTTLSSLSVRTEYHHTGYLTPYVPKSYQDKWAQVFNARKIAATFEKDQYHLEIPGSVVVDIDQDITSPTNLDATRTFKPRLSGKWALFTLDFLGTATQKYLLHTLRVIARPIAR